MPDTQPQEYQWQFSIDETPEIQMSGGGIFLTDEPGWGSEDLCYFKLKNGIVIDVGNYGIGAVKWTIIVVRSDNSFSWNKPLLSKTVDTPEEAGKLVEELVVRFKDFYQEGDWVTVTSMPDFFKDLSEERQASYRYAWGRSFELLSTENGKLWIKHNFGLHEGDLFSVTTDCVQVFRTLDDIKEDRLKYLESRKQFSANKQSESDDKESKD